MNSFVVENAEVTWLRLPFPTPIADSTHAIEVMDFVVLELEDEAGKKGTSYMLGFDYATEVLFRIAEDAARKAVGSDARFRNETWRKLWTDYEYIGRDGVAAWGVAAVDLALWDLYGHQTGQPVWALVGGTKQATPAYGSGGWLSYSEKELIGEAEAYLKRGLGAYKIKVGLGVDEDVRRVRAVRAALGSAVPLMIDANQGYDLVTARRLAKAVSDQNIRWFEEPMPISKVQDYRVLRETIDIPIALGERSYYPSGLSPVIEAGGVDVIMPDALRIGGVRGWLDLAGRAAAEGIAIAPHYYREFDAPLAASTIGSIYVENFFWTDQVFDWDGAYKDGCVLAPDSPGFGFRLREDARERWKVKQARVSSK